MKKALKIILLLCLIIPATGFTITNKVNSGALSRTANFQSADILNGRSTDIYDNAIKITLSPASFKSTTSVEIIALEENIKMPWKLDRLSKVYQFDFSNKAGYQPSKPIYINLSYQKSSDYLKKIYYFDKSSSVWRPLPTKDYPKEKYVISQIHLPYARIAVFANTDIMSIGTASWYSHKKGDYAASPDFPAGARLRVHNLDNKKFVDVTVNDFGPDRKAHPDRVVDLEKNAFAKIADKNDGLAKVMIEPLMSLSKGGKVLWVDNIPESNELKVKAKSAIVMNESTGEIIYNKNANLQLPLASLSKLVAIKVFLDTKPALNKIVPYSIKDEEYNYKYVDYKWQSARLKVANGETLSVEDLIYAALVGSANNAVESLVRVSGLSRQEFIERMNQTAASWGTLATHFEEPTGLSPENVSSAFDYAIITRECFKNPIIQKASTISEYKFKTRNTKKEHRMVNTNKLVKSSDFTITGSKTGYLEEAGYCLMTRVKGENGQQIIAVTFGEISKNSSISETRDLLKFGLIKCKSK